MRWRIWREYKNAFFPSKNETHRFGEDFEDNGSGSRVMIWLKFPDGATSNNYNLPSEILMYDGNIRNLYDKNTDPIISPSETPVTPLPEDAAEPESAPGTEPGPAPKPETAPGTGAESAPEPKAAPGEEPEPEPAPDPGLEQEPESEPAPEPGTDGGGGRRTLRR